MELLTELKPRTGVSGRWKWGWVPRRVIEVLPEHARVERGKPQLSWSEGCEGLRTYTGSKRKAEKNLGRCSEYLLTGEVVRLEVLSIFSGVIFNWLNQYLCFTEQTQGAALTPSVRGDRAGSAI